MNTIYTEEKFVGEKKEEICFEYHSISEINISHYSEKSLHDYKWKCLMAFYFKISQRADDSFKKF